MYLAYYVLTVRQQDSIHLIRRNGLSSSQDQASKRRPPIPVQQRENSPLLVTPNGSRFIDQTTHLIRRKTDEKQAPYPALHKASHATDSLNLRQVALKHRNTQLQAQLAALTNKRRRKAPVNPNTQVANTNNIMMANQAQAVLGAPGGSRPVRHDAQQALREF